MAGVGAACTGGEPGVADAAVPADGHASGGRAPGAAGPAGPAGREEPAGLGPGAGTAGGGRFAERAAAAEAGAAGGGAAGACGRTDSARECSGSLAAGDAAAETCGADAVDCAEGTDGVEAPPAAVRCGPAWAATERAEGADSRRTANTALHTVQRARTPASGTFTGSTRYTVAQLGQVTFIW